ncbi:MAG: hypothetical protein FIA89_01795 [Geobacter sp.]|nr:hypothetical protein [Geobacter sp.]
MYRTILCSTGNPDHGQYVAVSPSAVAKVKSIEDAVTACREYISEWDLGGGNWCGDAGKVFLSDKLVARIAYNGKVLQEQ